MQRWPITYKKCSLELTGSFWMCVIIPEAFSINRFVCAGLFVGNARIFGEKRIPRHDSNGSQL